MSDLSVRERVKTIQREMLDGNLLPARARELLVTLTSLLGNCNEELLRTHTEYTTVLARELDAEQTANRAKIRAAQSEEFHAWQTARNTQALVTEMIRTLKAILRSIETEMSLSR